jgi:hypothetical protein
MRLLDDRGALTALMRFDNAPDRPLSMDFSAAIPADFDILEQALRKLLADRESFIPRETILTSMTGCPARLNAASAIPGSFLPSDRR